MEEYIKQIHERFLKDTKNHGMEILKDDGVYRHIKYSGEHGAYWYTLTTWPGHLCISGDMGTCVFARVEDMFEFFIMNDSDWNKPNVINPGYWEEKVLSISKFGDGIKEFCKEAFEQFVYQKVREHFKDDDMQMQDCMEEVEADVLCDMHDNHPQVLFEKLQSFSYKDFCYDVHSWPNFYRYTHYYIWLCYAIVQGITIYNAASKIMNELKVQ